MSDHPQAEISERRLAVLCVLIAALVFIIDSLIPLGVAGGVPYILVVLVSVRSTNRRLPYYAAVCTSALTIAGFFTSPPGGELWKVLCNRSLALFAIWTTAVLIAQRRAAYEERIRALSELDVLRGLLPICSSCKKIRDDKDTWQTVETYVEKHSEASFSHGICPDCLQKMFPGEELDLNDIYKSSSEKGAADQL